MRTKHCLTSVVFSLGLLIHCQAAVLLDEPFGYPDGNLAGTASSSWVAHSDGGANPVRIQSGRIAIVSGNGAREDVSIEIPGQPLQPGGAVGSVYASFTVNCSALPTAAGTYFAHFQQSTNIFRGRVWASTTGAAAGTFRLGIGNSALASATTGQIPQDLQLNTDYRMLVRYDINTGLSTMWINPVVESSGGTTADDAPSVVAIERFGFRQGATGGAGRSGVIAVDDLLIGSAFDDVLVVDAPPTITAIANQQIGANSDTGPLSFALGDDLLAPGELTVSAGSDNLALVPVEDIVFDGSGSDRTVTITPVLNQIGLANITLTVSDGVNFTPTMFTLTVVDDEPPTVTAISDVQLGVNGSTDPIGFTVGDTVVPAADLSLGKDSDNLSLVPLNNIVFGGTGMARTVTITPAAGQTGVAMITITVSDGANSAFTAFQLTVVADQPPSISAIPNQQIAANGSTGPIGFVVGDDLTDPTALVLFGESADEALVPPSGIGFAGGGSNRMVTITPAARTAGSTTITISVNDGNQLASTSFLVTVVDEEPPSVSAIADQSLPANGTTGPMSFTIGDNVVAAGSLVLTTGSDNLNLVPIEGIVLGGSGADRTIAVTPASNQQGAATISLEVSDGQNVASRNFLVTVGFPAIAPVEGQFTPVDTALGPVPVFISHGALDPASLILTAESSNEALISEAGLVIEGTSGNRSLRATPAAGQTGVTIITLTASDGVQSVQQAFAITVHPYAGPLFSDDFSRPEEGPVVDDFLWWNHGGAPYETPILVNQLWLSQLRSEDFHRRLHPTTSFAPAASNVLYLAFRVNMSTPPNGSGSYFAHFNTNGFRGRVFARTNFAAAGQYRLGIANATLNPLNDSFLTRDLALNQDYQVVVRYSVVTGESRLWVDPADMFSESVAATDTPQPVTIDTFSFRQSDPGNPLGMGVLTLDDLKAGTAFSDVLSVNLPPRLGFIRQNQSLRLSWPAGQGFILQRTPFVPPPGWSDVPFVTEGAEDVSDVDISTGSEIFRLRRVP